MMEQVVKLIVHSLTKKLIPSRELTGIGRIATGRPTVPKLEGRRQKGRPPTG